MSEETILKSEHEKAVSELNETIEKQNLQAEEHEATVKRLNEKITSLEENGLKLDDKISELAATIAKQKSALNTYEALAAKADKKPVKEEEKVKVPTKTIKVKGKEYKWNVARFFHAGTEMIAEDASFDKKLLEELVSVEGQGLLREVV